MKKIFPLILIVVILLVAGCTKSQEDPVADSVNYSQGIRQVTVQESSGSTDVYTVYSIEISNEVFLANILPSANKEIGAEDNIATITASDLGLSGTKQIELNIGFGGFSDETGRGDTDTGIAYDVVYNFSSIEFRTLDSDYQYIHYLPVQSEIIVGIWDSGVAVTNPEIADSMWQNTGEIANNGVDDDGNGYVDDRYGMNFKTGYGEAHEPFPDDVVRGEHGTQVAGIIGRKRNYKQNSMGINPDAKLMTIKGRPHSVEAIDYAIKNNVDILNCSFGTTIDGNMEAEYQKAIDAGILVITSAGNKNSDIANISAYPARYEGVISVSEWDHKRGYLNSQSNFGQLVEFAAPGGNMFSTYGKKNKRSASGTSMAAPVIAGIMARIKGYDPSLTNAQIIQKLIDHHTAMNEIKYGLIDVKKLVESFGFTFEKKYLKLSLSDGTDALLEFDIGTSSGTQRVMFRYLYTNTARYSVHKELDL